METPTRFPNTVGLSFKLSTLLKIYTNGLYAVTLILLKMYLEEN